MHVSLRVPPETNELLKALSIKTGKTMTALILEALNEKYKLKDDRSRLVHQLAGWMPLEECEALRNSAADFEAVDERDWP